MKELLFEYDMHLDFAPPVEEHRFTLKCIPQTDQRQLIKRLDVEVYPKEFLSTDEDSFGNYSIYGYTKGKHDRFFARIRGRALTGLAPYLPSKAAHQVGLFRYQTDYTRPGPAILRFAERFAEAMKAYDAACAAISRTDTPDCTCEEGINSCDRANAVPPGTESFSPAVENAAETRSVFHMRRELRPNEAGERFQIAEATNTDTCRSDLAVTGLSDTPALTLAITLMHGLYENFTYTKGVTNISTTAEEAMALGEGVCQDYAHILLSLCRLKKIPCRYVVGMLIGEGESHAWVEIESGGHWYALDPTNDLLVDDTHIKISAGRDYRDCIVSQGVFVGQTTQTQTVAVRVREV